MIGEFYSHTFPNGLQVSMDDTDSDSIIERYLKDKKSLTKTEMFEKYKHLVPRMLIDENEFQAPIILLKTRIIADTFAIPDSVALMQIRNAGFIYQSPSGNWYYHNLPFICEGAD